MALLYTGNKLNQSVTIKRPNRPDEYIAPYLADQELVRAVNIAIKLKRPLLLMGEPGCGKSRLAQAIAYELYHNQNGAVQSDYKSFYEEWHIKSTSKAQDGLYQYDAIGRLGEAQLLSSAEKKNLDKKNFISLGPMGRAFSRSVEESKRVVLLIDEIDKADIDFPNDLLNELDKGEFKVTETNEEVFAPVKPIVIITSNGEKPLSDAFLRRCLFHYIEPLSGDHLQRIVKSKFYSDGIADNSLIKLATDVYIKIREQINANKMSLGKNISTSEFLDWFEAIKYSQELTNNQSLLPEEQQLKDEFSRLTIDGKTIPFKQILFKNLSTLLNFKDKLSS